MSLNICFVCEKEIEPGQFYNVLMSNEIIHSVVHKECFPELKNKLSEGELKTLKVFSESELP